MICGNSSDFIDHPLPKDSVSAHGPLTTPGPQAPHHLNPALMLSAAKNGKVSKEKKRKNLAVLAKTQRLKCFFLAKLLSSNVKTVALTRAPENVGENQTGN